MLQNTYHKAEATYFVLNDLFDAIESGREPETGARDNLNAMRAMEAAYRSVEQRRPMAVEEIQ